MTNEKYLNGLKTAINAYAEKLAKLRDSFKGKSKEEIENISQSLENLKRVDKER